MSEGWYSLPDQAYVCLPFVPQGCSNFVNVAESIDRPVDRTTLQMNDVDFIKKSIDKHSHHPSVKLINEQPENQCKFEFKYVSHKEVETILSKLNTKKATGCDGLPPKFIKAAASAISAPLSSIVNNSFDQCKFPTKAKFAEVGPSFFKLSNKVKCHNNWIAINTDLYQLLILPTMYLC